MTCAGCAPAAGECCCLPMCVLAVLQGKRAESALQLATFSEVQLFSFFVSPIGEQRGFSGCSGENIPHSLRRAHVDSKTGSGRRPNPIPCWCGPFGTKRANEKGHSLRSIFGWRCSCQTWAIPSQEPPPNSRQVAALQGKESKFFRPRPCWWHSVNRLGRPGRPGVREYITARRCWMFCLAHDVRLKGTGLLWCSYGICKVNRGVYPA